MNILEIDEKQRRISLRITNIDDLWFLSNFIEKGDIIFGYIYRKEEEQSDSVRSKKTERIRIHVGIEVENLEFQRFSNRLRIKGTIKIGPEEYIGFHQSMNIEEGMEFEIIKKDWENFKIEELKKAEETGTKSIFVSIDDEQATIALLKDYAIQTLAEIRLNRNGKDEEIQDKINYDEVKKKIEQYWDGKIPIIIVGPGFFKDYFIDSLNEEIKKHVMTVNTSYAGEKGIYEALKSGTLDRLLKEQRMKTEISLVEELLNEIGKNGKYAYGLNEIKKALDFGAVEKLLVTDKHIKDEDFVNIMKMAEKQNAEIHIISSEHEYGKILENLGGIGAILRFKVI